MKLATAELETLLGDRLSWRERMAGGPEWLTGALVATAAARERLLAWWDRAPRPWASPAPEQLRTNLHIYGDPAMLGAVVGTVSLAPPPVASHAVDACTFLLVGKSWGGWCAPGLDLGGRPYTIVLGHGGDSADLFVRVAHELGHSWLLPAPIAPCRGAETERTFLRSHDADVFETLPAFAQLVLRERDRISQRNERQADALAVEILRALRVAHPEVET